MQFHLIETADGVALALVYFEPQNIDAPVVICTHGVGNSFCTTPLRRVAHAIHALGWGVASLLITRVPCTTSNDCIRTRCASPPALQPLQFTVQAPGVLFLQARRAHHAPAILLARVMAYQLGEQPLAVEPDGLHLPPPAVHLDRSGINHLVLDADASHILTHLGRWAPREERRRERGPPAQADGAALELT